MHFLPVLQMLWLSRGKGASRGGSGICFRRLLNATLEGCSGDVPLGGGPGETSGPAGELYRPVAWERVRVPPEELEEKCMDNNVWVC